MLTIRDPRPTRTCAGLQRRELLRIGALGLGGMFGLPEMLATKASAGTTGLVRDRSVVLLFLQGGPPHIEFFDPKMNAPSEIRSTTGEIATRHPGITFGGTFPRLAAMADKFSIIRSYGSGNSGHTYESVTTAGNPLKASMGAMYARVVGTNHPKTGMPTNVLVLPEAVKDGLKLGSNFETGALPTLTPVGELGASYQAFNPAGGGPLKEAMEMRLSSDRLEDRRYLLAELDRYRRVADNSDQFRASDRFQQQAFDVITRGVAQAFDLNREDQATRDLYDTSKLFDDATTQRFYDQRRSSNQLGRQMLLARRLCEAGCGFVTVSDCGWDMHANGNSPKFMANLPPMAHQVDHAVAAFIEDVRRRGLSDKILLAVTGEMGRTPRINNSGGRDHYGELTSLLLFGGGLKMGQVIGQTDAFAAKATTEPSRPINLLGTLYNALFDASVLRLQTNIPRDISKLSEAEPIVGV
jgi:hypothetical protein